MSLDDLLIAIIIIGIGLSGAYLKAEYELQVRLRTKERSTGVVLHAVHASRVRMEQNGMPVHVRIARAPMQSPLSGTIRFLARNSHSAQEHRAARRVNSTQKL